MLKLSKLGRSFKILVFLRHIFILLFVYHSENSQKCCVHVRFDFVSRLFSEEESLHSLHPRNVNNKYCTALLSPVVDLRLGATKAWLKKPYDDVMILSPP